MDQAFDYKKFMKDLAKKTVDEELTRNPEKFSQREKLIEKKAEELEQKADERNSRTNEELKRAGEILIKWIQTLPQAEREKVTKELMKINQKIASDPLILTKFLSGDFNLQKLLQVEDSFMQQIYTIAIGYQDESHHLDAAALFKFLIVLNPYVTDFWIGLGFSSMHLHELEEAQNYFDTAITMDTLNPRGYYFGSLCSKMRKDTHKATNYCEIGLGLGNQEWDAPFANLKHSLGG